MQMEMYHKNGSADMLQRKMSVQVPGNSGDLRGKLEY